MRPLFVTLALLGIASQAHAGFGGVKTMREPLQTKEVERSLLLPKGWLEGSVGFTQKNGIGQWTEEGDRELFDSANWRYRTASLDIRYGIARRGELWWHLPFHHATLTNSQLGTNTSDMSIGDPRFGYRRLLTPVEDGDTFVTFEAWMKVPAAQESPGSYIGGPLNVSGFVFTTGTPDAFLGAAARQNVGSFLAVTATAGYVRRFAGVVQYLVETERHQFSGRIKPGDQLRAELEVMGQVGPVALAVTPAFTHRFATRVGTTAAFPRPNRNLAEVSNSDGNALDLGLAATINVSRGFDVVGHATLPVMGEDLHFFPIEDLQPTLGPTFGGNLEFRY